MTERIRYKKVGAKEKQRKEKKHKKTREKKRYTRRREWEREREKKKHCLKENENCPERVHGFVAYLL